MIQKLNKGDKKRDKDTYLLGDCASAICIKKNAGNGFEILDVSIKRVETGIEDTVIPFVKEMCEKKGIKLSDLQWIVCHNAKEIVYEKIKRTLSTARLLRRDEFSKIDFGCADPFISLSLIEKESGIEHGELGCLVFLGKTNHIGVVLIRYRKGNV